MSSLEWIGEEIRLPAFRLHTSRAGDASIDRFVGSNSMVQTLMAAAGHAPPTLLPLPAESALSRRAELSAPEAAAVEAFFSPTRCDVLDALLVAETVEVSAGRIMIMTPGFPAPRSSRRISRGEQRFVAR